MSDLPPRETATPPEPPLDRTISPVAGRLASGRRGKVIAFTGLLAGCAVVALATWRAEQPAPARPREVPARQVVAYEPAKPTPTLAAPGPDAPRLDGAVGDVPALAPLDGQTPQSQASTPNPRAIARRAPLMAYSRGDGLTAQPTLAQFAPATAATEQVATELDALRRSYGVGRAKAHTVGDRNFLILAGATIPCVLQTALDTTTAGYVTCLIGEDVYSDNGAVVLLEKGTRVLGEYRTGMRQGQDRIFVLWTRAVTPNGIAIPLASPASDALGRAGFGGRVDTHFWDRFGAAVLLSVVDQGSAAVADRHADAAGLRRPSDAAGQAVQQGANILPSLRKAQGAEVAIQVAQDFDFSGVYALTDRP